MCKIVTFGFLLCHTLGTHHSPFHLFIVSRTFKSYPFFSLHRSAKLLQQQPLSAAFCCCNMFANVHTSEKLFKLHLFVSLHRLPPACVGGVASCATLTATSFPLPTSRLIECQLLPSSSDSIDCISIRFISIVLSTGRTESNYSLCPVRRLSKQKRRSFFSN